MLYRFAAFGIITFWLVMMGMLVRLEVHPDETNILDVPVSYVVRIMFKHGQSSFLDVRDGEKPVGSISLRPSITGTDARLLDFSGTLSVQMPLSNGRQRYNFNGGMAMNAALEVRTFHLDFTVQEPHTRLAVQGDIPRKLLTYQTYFGDHVSSSQRLPLDAAGITPALMQSVGLDPGVLPIVPTGMTPPTVSARETQITMHGEKLDVYQVSIHEGASTAMDIYMTQLGQVVLVNTNFGYTLGAEDYQ
ncbi:MAG TPA: hypothetical protein VHY22_13915 [Chthoniobacteraceae bacterium]|jgi:hypothetical protein|nr:hypothetical protein [Chthoniobacteraceae bacterium]